MHIILKIFQKPKNDIEALAPLIALGYLTGNTPFFTTLNHQKQKVISKSKLGLLIPITSSILILTEIFLHYDKLLLVRYGGHNYISRVTITFNIYLGWFMTLSILLLGIIQRNQYFKIINNLKLIDDKLKLSNYTAIKHQGLWEIAIMLMNYLNKLLIGVVYFRRNSSGEHFQTILVQFIIFIQMQMITNFSILLFAIKTRFTTIDRLLVKTYGLNTVSEKIHREILVQPFRAIDTATLDEAFFMYRQLYNIIVSINGLFGLQVLTSITHSYLNVLTLFYNTVTETNPHVYKSIHFVYIGSSCWEIWAIVRGVSRLCHCSEETGGILHQLRQDAKGMKAAVSIFFQEAYLNVSYGF